MTLGDAPVTEPKPVKTLPLAPTKFDGRWSATVGPQGACNFTSRLILDVKGSSIVGNAANSSGVFPLSGTVDPSGTGVFTIGGFVGAVKFSGTTFEANYANNCGSRFATGTKNLSAGPGGPPVRVDRQAQQQSPGRPGSGFATWDSKNGGWSDGSISRPTPPPPPTDMSTEAGIRAQADRIFGPGTGSHSHEKEMWIANRLSEQLDRQRGNSLSIRLNR